MSLRLTESEFHRLAAYNGRRSKERVHIVTDLTEWWEMAILQWRWNVDQREQLLDAGFVPLMNGGGYIQLSPGPGIETLVSYDKDPD